MKHGLTFPRPNRHFLSYLLLWCLKCCFFSSPLRGQGWMWELRVAHEASVCAEWAKTWGAMFLSSASSFLVEPEVGLVLQHVEVPQFHPRLSVQMWQPILGSPVINIHLHSRTLSLDSTSNAVLFIPSFISWSCWAPWVISSVHSLSVFPPS